MNASAINDMPRRLPALRGALLTVAVLAAPFYSGSTSALGQAINETILLAIAVVSFGGLFWSNRGRIAYSDVELTGIAFLAAAVFSGIFAVFHVDAWNTLGTMILLGIGYRAAASEAHEANGFGRFFAIALIVSGLLQTVIAAHQYFFPRWYADAMPEFYRLNIFPNMRGGVVRAVGGFINANYFAAFLNIGLAVSLAFALFAVMKLWQRIAFGSAAALMIVGVFLSGSKGALLVSAAILATLAAIKDRRILWLVLIVLVLIVILPNPVRDSVIRGVTADAFVQMRPAIWNAAANMFRDNILFGVGPGNFHYASFVYAPATDFQLVKYSRVPGIAHNSYLHGLAEFGLVGGGLLLFIAALVSWLSFQALRDHKTFTDPPLALGLAAGILGVFMHSMIDNVANNRAVLTTMIIAIALLASLSASSWFSRRRVLNIQSKRNALVAVAVTLLVAGFYIAQVIKPLAYEKRISKLQNGLNEQIVELRQGRENETAGLGPIPLIRGYLTELEELLQHYPDNPAVNRAIGTGHRVLFNIDGNFTDFLEADRAFQRASETLHGRSRSDHYLRLLLRFDLTRHGYPKTEDILESMEELAMRATTQWPNRAAFHHAAATVARERGDYAAAKERLERALALEPNFLQAIADLIRVADSTGDVALRQKGEHLLTEAFNRIEQGPPPEVTDDYAQSILASPH